VNSRSARSRRHMVAGWQYVLFVSLAGVIEAENGEQLCSLLSSATPMWLCSTFGCPIKMGRVAHLVHKQSRPVAHEQRTNGLMNSELWNGRQIFVDPVEVKERVFQIQLKHATYIAQISIIWICFPLSIRIFPFGETRSKRLAEWVSFSENRLVVNRMMICYSLYSDITFRFTVVPVSEIDLGIIRDYECTAE